MIFFVPDFLANHFQKLEVQDGLEDPELGDLYRQILKVVRYHKPSYFILENVPNLEKHDKGKTWDHIKEKLEKAGYTVKLERLSPHNFGIPQIRQRMYIVGSRFGLDAFNCPQSSNKKKTMSIEPYLESYPKNARTLPLQVQKCLEVWQEFLDHVRKTRRLFTRFGRWSSELLTRTRRQPQAR